MVYNTTTTYPTHATRVRVGSRRVGLADPPPPPTKYNPKNHVTIIQCYTRCTYATGAPVGSRRVSRAGW